MFLTSKNVTTWCYNVLLDHTRFMSVAELAGQPHFEGPELHVIGLSGSDAEMHIGLIFDGRKFKKTKHLRGLHVYTHLISLGIIMIMPINAVSHA